MVGKDGTCTADEWDPDTMVCWNPPKDRVFTGGEPVVKPPKCFGEVTFSFDDDRLAELQRLSEADDVVGAGKGYYDLAKLYDAGSGVEKCLEKAFQLYKAAMREGWIPAFDAVRSRLRDPDDQLSIQQCKGVYIKLYAPPHDSKDFDSALRRLGQFKAERKEDIEQIFIDAGDSPCFPLASPALTPEQEEALDFESRW